MRNQSGRERDFSNRLPLSFRFALTQQSIDILGKIAHSLFSWTQPQLPEVLCLLRFDGEPWLITTAHENDGDFVLSPEEKVALVTKVPELVISDEVK